MKPVYQKEVDNYTTGDCFSACLASILEVNLEEVPNFHKCIDFWRGVDEWLNNRNLCICHYVFNDIEEAKRSPTYDELDCIIIAPSGVENSKLIYHAVVGKANKKGTKQTHNPHPSNGKLKNIGPVYVTFINKLKEKND